MSHILSTPSSLLLSFPLQAVIGHLMWPSNVALMSEWTSNQMEPHARVQVKCTECGFESNTSDTFLDVSLEINRAQTVERALQRFTGTEYLEGDNKYRCPQQKCMVRAAKRMAFEKAPCVLLLHLKRFEYSMYGQKITKKVCCQIPPLA